MENENSHNFTKSLEFLSDATIHVIRIIEGELNDRLFDSDIEKEAFIESRVDELNRLYLEDQIGIAVDCLGFAYVGQVDSENLESDDKANIINLDEYIYNGFSFKLTEGSKDYIAVLEFMKIVDIYKPLQDDEDETCYYIKPTDLLTIERSENPTVSLSEILDDLSSSAVLSRARIEGQEYLDANNSRRYEILNELIDRSQTKLLSCLYNEDVHISTKEMFYLNEGENSSFTIEHVIQDKTDRPSLVARGKMHGCSFYEIVAQEDLEIEPDFMVGQLKKNEPCIVLIDNELRARYLVPISAVTSIKPVL